MNIGWKGVLVGSSLFAAIWLIRDASIGARLIATLVGYISGILLVVALIANKSKRVDIPAHKSIETIQVLTATIGIALITALTFVGSGIGWIDDMAAGIARFGTEVFWVVDRFNTTGVVPPDETVWRFG